MTGLREDEKTGIARLTAMLPALASYYDPRDTDSRDTCLVCQDGECGGACQGAMEVVRQIIEALGCGEDDWDWWRESFAEDGVTVPPARAAQTDAATALDDRLVCCPECRSVFEAEDGTLITDTSAALAEAWDEGFTAAYEWIERNPGPSGIWSDPPTSPYSAALTSEPQP